MDTHRQESPAEDPAEQLLAGVVARDAAEQAAAFEQVVALHPGLADALRARWSLFQRLVRIAPAAAGEPLRPFGEYELLRELGRGGMGVVYLARQRRGEQQRLVALKLVRDRGLISAEAHERLRREGAATFRLDHPGICQVLDVGEVEGTPYLTMRFVPGATLAERIAAARASGAPLELPSDPALASSHTGTSTAAGVGHRVGAIVALVENVARALHFAHQAGFVHRDVKPGNIMVTPEGLPVLLDFGLVRDEASDHGITVSGQTLGTPAYMSPEQIEPRGRPVDATTDVYSLGATLYEALALRQPFTGQTREALFRDILDGRPPDLCRVAPSVSRDLRVVVETAMAHDPARRYATALEFADELRRVRQAQPIFARPPGLARRLQLWSQRNPLAAGMLVLLGLALATNVWLAARAEQRAQEAKAAEKQAVADFASARDAVEELTTLARTHLADVPSLETVRRELFERALEFHRAFLDRDASSPELRVAAAITQVQYGSLQAHLGDLTAARASLAQGTSTLQELGATGDVEAMRWLARAHVMQARVAEEHDEDAAASASYRAAITTFEALAKGRPLTVWEAANLSQAHRQLATNLETRAKPAEAVVEIEAALAIGMRSRDPSLLTERSKALAVRAHLRRGQQDVAGADADLREAASLLREVLGKRPDDRDARSTLANNLTAHAALHAAQDRVEPALAAYAEARALLEDLTRTFPLASAFRRNFANLLGNEATLLRRQGQLDAARTALARSVELFEGIAREDPTSTSVQESLAQAHYNLGNAVRGEDVERAIGEYGAALAICTARLQQKGDDRGLRDLACRTANGLAASLARSARDAEALVAFETARGHGAELLRRFPDDPRWRRTQSLLLYNEGNLAAEMGDLVAAVQRLTEATELDAALVGAAAADARSRADQLKHCLRLAQIATLRDPTTALPHWRAAAGVLTNAPEAVRRRVEATSEARFEMACVERGLAASLVAANDLEGAGQALERAMRLLAGEGSNLAVDVERFLLALTVAARHRAGTNAEAAAAAVRSAIERAAGLVAGIGASRLHSQRVHAALPALAELATAAGVGEGADVVARLRAAVTLPK